MAFILALDQGTTSSRAILFDHAGDVQGTAQKEFTQHFPEPGRVEHDPKEIWETQLSTAREVLSEQQVSSKDIAAIGITNQRETVVLWDRVTGEPVTPAIVWQDRRTAGFCDGLTADGRAREIQDRTGLVIDAYFSASKLRWMLDHVPGARVRAESGELCFGTVDSWLIYNLTDKQRHVTDVSNASRTMLYNIHEGKWDATLLSLFQIPAGVLPEVCSSSEVYGHSASHWFEGSIPIAGIAGDQQAALFGQACHEPGQAKNTYGTGCFMLMNTGTRPQKSENQLLSTVAWQIGDQLEYALEGSVFIAGAAVQWLRDQLGFFESAYEIEALAATVEDNGGVYLVPAFAGLGAPHWDPYARGSLVGLTRGSNKAHIARAALESIAYQSRDVLTAMEADSDIHLTELRVDGGACQNDLLMQFQADLLDVPVIRPAVAETTALGAAYLAGLAVGYWKERSEVAQNWQEDKRFEPAMNEETRRRLLAGWEKAVQAAKGWAS